MSVTRSDNQEVTCYIQHLAQASTRTVAVVSQPVTLGCVTISGTEPVWYFNEVPITFTALIELVVGGLKIGSVQMQHAGRYTCVDPDAPSTNLFTRDFVLVVECKLLSPCSICTCFSLCKNCFCLLMLLEN